MEKKIKQLFDYQKFSRNPRLDAMLAEAEGRYAAVDDDALEMVSAAGEPVPDAAFSSEYVGALMVPEDPAIWDATEDRL